MRSGKFREDLYYRLDVVQLRTAPLRERPGDIPDLAEAFLKQLAEGGLPRCSLSPQGRVVLADFHWPGNVRQLRNVLEQAVIDSPTPIISAGQLQRIISMSFVAVSEYAFETDESASDTREGNHQPSPRPDFGELSRVELGTKSAVNHQQNAGGQLWQTLDDLERQHIVRTLEHTFYNRSAACAAAGRNSPSAAS